MNGTSKKPKKSTKSKKSKKSMKSKKSKKSKNSKKSKTSKKSKKSKRSTNLGNPLDKHVRNQVLHHEQFFTSPAQRNIVSLTFSSKYGSEHFEHVPRTPPTDRIHGSTPLKH